MNHWISAARPVVFHSSLSPSRSDNAAQFGPVQLFSKLVFSVETGLDDLAGFEWVFCFHFGYFGLDLLTDRELSAGPAPGFKAF
jgi:hypothetical protein